MAKPLFRKVPHFKRTMKQRKHKAFSVIFEGIDCTNDELYEIQMALLSAQTERINEQYRKDLKAGKIFDDLDRPHYG